MKESRASELRKTANKNDKINKKERERLKKIEADKLEIKEKLMVKNLVDKILIGIEDALQEAVIDGCEGASFDFRDHTLHIPIELCQRYPKEIEKLCEHYAKDLFDVNFKYVFYNAGGSTSMNSYIYSRFTVGFDDKCSGKIEIDLDPCKRLSC